MRTHSKSIFTLLLTLALAACGGSDSTGPDANQAAMQRLAGSYTLTEAYGPASFTTTAGGQTVDWLALGATFAVELRADGTTTGQIFVPGADEDGQDFRADLAGTWTVRNDTVRFSHTADTFVRDMPFAVQGSQLVGDRTFGDTRVQLTLQRR